MTEAPRPLATGIFRFVLVTLVTVLFLVATALLISATIAWLHGGEWNESPYVSIGLICAMVAWLFITVFHLRRETQNMAFAQRDEFMAKTIAVLQTMGYSLASQQDNGMTFRPGFDTYLLGGGISVEVDKHDAKFTGPKFSLERFRHSFRLHNHVQRMQLYLQDHHRISEPVIKCAEVRLRLLPEQLEVVNKKIIEHLNKEGTIVCDLNLLVQSEHGIHENTLNEIRHRFEQQGIACEIHKDVVQSYGEPV